MISIVVVSNKYNGEPRASTTDRHHADGVKLFALDDIAFVEPVMEPTGIHAHVEINLQLLLAPR